MSGAVIGGMAQGASSGFQAGGTYGAVLGAAVGAWSGNLKRAADAQMVKANRRAGFIKDLQGALIRRNIVQEAYVTRQEMIARAAAGSEDSLKSTGAMGSSASIGSQMRQQLGVFDLSVQYQRQMEKFMKKAGKLQEKAATIDAVWGSLTSAVSGGMVSGQLGGGGGSSVQSGLPSSGNSGYGGSIYDVSSNGWVKG